MAFLCAVLASSPAFAATIQPGQGQLLINRGQGFQPVTGPVDANPGDQIMVDPGGSAQLVYGDGCNVAVKAGEVTVVTAQSPCVNPYAQQEPTPPPPDAGNAALAWGLGLAGAGALGWGIYEATKSTPGPTSP